ncbi:hypothetical protein [Thiocystis violascens]|uniref:Uncharacterized protein n=1 Tax=Thiocystis violascens (strain ATCC 17096 / DSM 198 / 6111) TaxID=765911 RepID=I3YGX1_THIV6|nr:hypothetical protein [Thiocystis violascens]AFL76239.1 hypothetical protein Thivi_4437 [Thiocystis violascens DSM 198]
MNLTIDLGGSDNPLDDLERVSDCFSALDDLLQGCHLQDPERERLAVLIATLTLLQRAALDHLLDARLASSRLHAVA